MGALTQKTEDGCEVFYSEIHAALFEYIEDATANDPDFSMYKQPQSRWNSALIYIFNTVFKGTDKLRDTEHYNILNNNNIGVSNAYDLIVLNNIADYYISLCMEYNKEISIIGYCFLTGVSKECIYSWAGNSGYENIGSSARANRLGSLGVNLYKKLSENREESLSNKLVSGQGNPVGILGVLNRHYGWNMGQPRGVDGGKHQISTQDALKLASELSQNDTQFTGQIAEKVDSELMYNFKNSEMP